MSMASIREFTPLQIRRRLLGAGAASRYRIYRTKADFITLEARTATEACKVSGIKRPYKILRISPSTMKMLDSAVFDGATEATIETPKLELEGEAPIIIPAPMERGARIIDDYDLDGVGGGFQQVPLSAMGKRNAEDTAALKKVVQEIAAEVHEEPVLEKPVIITPDMITLDVTPGTNDPVYKIQREAPQPAPVATIAQAPLAEVKDKGDYKLVGTTPGMVQAVAEKEDYSREEMLLKQMMENRLENPPVVEKPEALRMNEPQEELAVAPAPAPVVQKPAPVQASASAEPGELTQEEIARLLGES